MTQPRGVKDRRASDSNGAGGAGGAGAEVRQKALIFHPQLASGRDGGGGLRPPAAGLGEAEGLARAIGLKVVTGLIIAVRQRRPATYLGAGKLDELKARVAAADIEVVIADCALSAVQQRNLERALGAKVIDRTGLILEIFGARARSREGRLQVELAHLSYQRGRLVRSWTHLERQRGGFGFLGGPGETQIETDRRLISKRIAKIRRQLETVKRTRGLHRASRRRVPYPIVALVGYTNAGKSTLFNHLTKADVSAADQLFETLDPTMRGVTLERGRRIILSDTVGFISQLPTQLIAAFRATLEEVIEADVIVHVRDIANPDSQAQCRDVAVVLGELGISENDERPMIEVLNKIDLLDPAERRALENRVRRRSGAVALSATSGEGVPALLAAVGAALSRHQQKIEITIAHSAGADITWLYRHGEVVTRVDTPDNILLQVLLSPENLGRWRQRAAGKPIRKLT